MLGTWGEKKTEGGHRPLESVQSAQDLNRSRSRAPKTDTERLLTPKEVAHFLRVSESWLAKARKRGDGPPYMMFGRAIRYGRARARPRGQGRVCPARSPPAAEHRPRHRR